MGYLKGADISHHNGKSAVYNILAQEADIDFFIVKATEGRTYVDPQCAVNCTDTLTNGRLLGLYHFARPDNRNTPLQEADNFLKVFSKYLGNAIPVLDWEAGALKCGTEWAAEWVKIVFETTGVKPMLYTSQSEVKRMSALCELDCGLWVARYNKNQTLGSVAPWTTWAMWQYDDGTYLPGQYDKDYFNGTKSQFMAYCKSALEAEEIKEPCHCGCSCCSDDEWER